MASGEDVSVLKDLQAELNTTFDAYFEQVRLEDKDGIAKSREQLLGYSSKLTTTVAGPVRQILQLTGGPIIYMAVRIALDWDIFPSMRRRSLTLEEITNQTGADSDLVERILRVVNSIGFVQQTETKQWTATPITDVMNSPAAHDYLISRWENMIDSTARLPVWLRERKWNPSPFELENIFKDVRGMLFWDSLTQNPQLCASFDSAMGIQDQFPPEMVPNYPFDTVTSYYQAVTLVDIGGGKGQAINKIRRQYPGLQGRFIVQDLEKTINAIPREVFTDLNIEPMVHDFFEVQPVKHARFYQLRWVLHNWSDDQASLILMNLRPAMVTSKSKCTLLIEDYVLPEMGCGEIEAVKDLVMMILFGGRERTMKQMRALLHDAGFQIVKVYEAAVGSMAIIEAEVLRTKDEMREAERRGSR